MDEGVSVVITCRPEAPGLSDTLAGVAAQTEVAAEVILVGVPADGGSDIRIPVLPEVRRIDTGAGSVAAACNLGLEAARHPYVVFLDVDAGDVLTPIALAAGLAAARQDPDAAFVHGAYRRMDAAGRAIGPRRHADLGSDAYIGLLEGNLIEAHAAVLYRCDALRAVGGFREVLQAFFDYDTHLRLARKHPVATHGAETARRSWPRSTTAQARRRLHAALRVHGDQRPRLEDSPAWQRAWRTGERRLRKHIVQEVLDDARRAGSPRRAAFASAATLSPRVITADLGQRALMWTAQALPARVGNAVARRRPDLRPLGLGRVRLGDLDRAEPVSRDFGFDRGLPVDRYYIEAFLDSARADVHGRVLEVGDAAYSQRFGGSKVERQDIVHVHAGNPDATIVGDISVPGTLPRSTFDCIVLTQTLHLIYDMRAAVGELHAALKPGGVLLLTVPGISQIDRAEWGGQWYWALTPAAVRRLLGEAFGDEAVTVTGHGNAYAATAFLQGLALSEVDTHKLDVHDDAYPVIVTAHATKWL